MTDLLLVYLHSFFLCTNFSFMNGLVMSMAMYCISDYVPSVR